MSYNELYCITLAEKESYRMVGNTFVVMGRMHRFMNKIEGVYTQN